MLGPASLSTARGDEAKLEALAVKEMGQGSVIIAGGFKTNEARRAAIVQKSGQLVEPG